MRKEELIDAADASGLSTAPVRGAGAAPAWAGGRGRGRGGPGRGFAYSGWSSMAKMYNRDPPLVQKFSNPPKFRLTPEVLVHGQPYGRMVHTEKGTKQP